MDQIDKEESYNFWLKYITIPIEVFANKKIDKTDMIIFFMIDHYDDGIGQCFVSNTHLSDITEIGVNAVSSSITKLEEMGYIKREIQKEKGNKRILSINPQYKIIHNQHQIEINKRIQSRKERKEKKVESALTDASPYHGRQGEAITVDRERLSRSTGSIYNNKIIIEEDYKNTSSKEDVGNKDVAANSKIVYSLDNNHHLAQYYPDAEDLFDFWNDLGKPLTKHYRGTKLFVTAIERISKELKRGYSVEEIGLAMHLYHQMLSEPQHFKLNLKIPYHKVNLDQFFKFSIFDKDNMIDANLVKINAIDSWFEECVQGTKYLNEKYGLVIEDKHPQITAAFRQLWQDSGFDGLGLSLKDENNFRRASVQLMDFIHQTEGRVDFTKSEIHYPAMIVQYVFNAIKKDIEGKSFDVSTGFLCSKNTYEKRLPGYLKANQLMN